MLDKHQYPILEIRTLTQQATPNIGFIFQLIIDQAYNEWNIASSQIPKLSSTLRQ